MFRDGTPSWRPSINLDQTLGDGGRVRSRVGALRIRFPGATRKRHDRPAPFPRLPVRPDRRGERASRPSDGARRGALPRPPHGAFPTRAARHGLCRRVGLARRAPHASRRQAADPEHSPGRRSGRHRRARARDLQLRDLHADGCRSRARAARRVPPAPTRGPAARIGIAGAHAAHGGAVARVGGEPWASLRPVALRAPSAGAARAPGDAGSGRRRAAPCRSRKRSWATASA